MDCGEVAIALLAAGQGRRFGGDKLTADLDGVPIGLRAANTLAGIGFEGMFSVCGKGGLAPALAGLGFQILHNDQPDLGQSHSLHLAVFAAQQSPAQALLVCLADMPFVTADHIQSLIAATKGHDGIIASHDGTRPLPPALFPRAFWPQLLETKGDAGARFLIADALHIHAPSRILTDIDTEADLAAAREPR